MLASNLSKQCPRLGFFRKFSHPSSTPGASRGAGHLVCFVRFRHALRVFNNLTALFIKNVCWMPRSWVFKSFRLSSVLKSGIANSPFSPLLAKTGPDLSPERYSQAPCSLAVRRGPQPQSLIDRCGPSIHLVARTSLNLTGAMTYRDLFCFQRDSGFRWGFSF